MQKQNRDHLSLKSKEALINEIKGLLFEYQLAIFIAKKFDIEEVFISSIDKEMLEKLIHYGDLLKRVDHLLWKQIFVLARESANVLYPKLSLINMIHLVGEKTQEESKEGDLLLIEGANKKFLSIKLSKCAAWVNLKSAGIKSCIEKYFDQFENAKKVQEGILKVVELEFNKTKNRLAILNDIDPSMDFNLEWQKKEKSFLPGELDKKESGIVKEFYHKMAVELYNAFVLLYESDSEKFVESLYSFVGASSDKVMQVLCFYNNKKNEKYLFDKALFFTKDFWKQEFLRVSILPVRDDNSFFEIAFKSHVLQVRLKPMNSFLVPALKINFSVKF